MKKTIVNNTVNTNTSVFAEDNDNRTYTTNEIAEYIGVSLKNLYRMIYAPHLCKGKGNQAHYTQDEVEEMISCFKNIKRRKTNKSVELSNQLTTISKMVSTIEQLEKIDKSPEMKAYREQKEHYEKLQPTDLQKMFMPILERFKFQYISKETEIQSQTLTCIKQANLRGMKSYELTYAAFVKLLQFAKNNHVDLEIPDVQ